MLSSLRGMFGRNVQLHQRSFGAAKAIGNEAARSASLTQDLGFVAKIQADGKPAWHFNTASMGHDWFLIIDDETGKPGPLTEQRSRQGLSASSDRPP